ncbi:hypothetical protein [Streptomyces sp. NBC_01237]|uniref:hypothetical protein n=1 Tax=Streptomyces sp. NBC_01237 TaxID=2903790 RepID=UPI002DD9F191|nr:hypothetical protein [Streptomyces sp. NBC_01237]WRZ77288.1 hypothetical protein OG251_37170 [Streptomyces sp. NBC_01237]
MPDTLGQLRTMAGVRRKDLAHLLAGVPQADMERALDPALRDSWTELAAAGRTGRSTRRPDLVLE